MVKIFDEVVDIGASPIATVSPVAIFCPSGSVGKFGGAFGVGVKVVIDMDAIDGVAANDIEDDIENIASGGGNSWIEPKLAGVVTNPFGVKAGDVVGSEGVFGVDGGAEGIEPSVELETSGVGGMDGEREGIVAWGGALMSGEKSGPGLGLGLIEGVAGGANLEEDRREFEFLGEVEKGEEFGLLGGGGEARFGGPVEIIDRGDPSTTELRRGGRSGGGKGDGGEKNSGKQLLEKDFHENAERRIRVETRLLRDGEEPLRFVAAGRDYWWGGVIGPCLRRRKSALSVVRTRVVSLVRAVR